MARIATANLGIGTWAEGDNPGAGSQTVQGGGGLNDNFLILDTAVGAAHTVAGAHKDNIIDKNHLKTTAADGSTLEKDATVGLRAKDDGITGAKLAAGIVDNSTLEATAATGAKTFRVKDAGITGAKLAAGAADGSTLEVASGSMRIKDAGITNAKFTTVGMTKTKWYQLFAFASATSQGSINGLTPASYTAGWTPPRACKVTGLFLFTTAWVRFESLSNSVTFTTSQVMVPEVGSNTFTLYRHGSSQWTFAFTGTPSFCLVEIEND